MIAKDFNQTAKLLQRLVRMKAADENGRATCVLCGRVDDYRSMDGAHYIPRTFRRWALSMCNVHCVCACCNRMDPTHRAAYHDWMVREHSQGFVDHMINVKRVSLRWPTEELRKLQKDLRAQIKQEKNRIGVLEGQA